MKNRLRGAVNAKEAYMEQKDNFEKKDWDKAAKAFARQAYGKRKLESIQLERQIREWAAKDEYYDD